MDAATDPAQRRADEIREQRRAEGRLGKVDPPVDREWCPECQSMQVVEDRFLEDTGDSRVTVEEYAVTAFECGHSTTRTTRTYRSPLQQAGLPRSYELGRLRDEFDGSW